MAAKSMIGSQSRRRFIRLSTLMGLGAFLSSGFRPRLHAGPRALAGTRTEKWRDGIGPRSQRPVSVIPWKWDKRRGKYGAVEPNSFGTDEYMRFCRRIGAEPCICVNTITGTPSEAFHWLEYCNFDGDSTYARLRGQNGHPEPYNVKYWKLGNEPEISARAYATQVMPFANALRRAGKHLPIELVTGVTAKNKIEWTRGLLAALKEGLSHEFDPPIDHLSLHHYALAGGSLIDFSDEQYYELLASRHRLERRIQLIIGIADQAWGRSKKLGLFIGEWGRVGNPGEQMYTQFNTFREAMLAAVYLDTFHKYADRVRMANVSHMINVGSCLIYANEETMFLTPNYYVWEMYKPHKGATSLQILAESPIIKEKALRRLVDHETKRDLRALSASTSMNPETRTLTVTFVNQSLTNDMELDIEARDTGSLGDATLTVLVSDDVRDINTFTNPHSVKPPQSEPVKGQVRNIKVRAPAHSINALTVSVR